MLRCSQCVYSRIILSQLSPIAHSVSWLHLTTRFIAATDSKATEFDTTFDDDIYVEN
jgi:hypothetical protein